jgi:hypothetical protein
MSKKLMLPASLSMIFLLTGCATNTFVTDASCKAFKPISASKADTEPTKRQVVGHNRAYDAICPAKG